MKNLKIFGVLIFICCMIFSFSSFSLAADFHPMAYGTFTGHIITDNTPYNFEQIEIKVYSSVLSSHNSTEGFQLFNEEYKFSVYPDQNGNFTFYKPSANFSVTINTATLPANTGTDFQTKFYPAGPSEDTIHLSTIDFISTGFENGDFSANFYNAEQEFLYVDYEITEILPVFQIEEISSLTSVSQLPLNVYIQYSGGALTTKSVYTANLSEMSFTEKANLASRLHCLSEESLSDISGSDSLFSYSSDDMIHISPSSATTQNVSTWLSEELGYTPTAYVQDNTYGYRVYYDAATMNSATASQALASLIDLHNYYVIGKGFSKPIPYEEGPYCLYLTNSESTLGVTYINGRKSLLIVHYDTIETNTVVNTVIAHEYMHGISSTYYLHQGEYCGFITEGCCNFSTYLYADDRGKGTEHAMDSHDANLAFLRSPHLSLTYAATENAQYMYRQATVFFWLNLYQNHGGWNIIKKIFEQSYQDYTSTQTNLDYPAVIEAALRQMNENDSFEELFSEFTVNNFAPRYFYDDIPASWDRITENGTIIGVNTFSMPGANLNGTKSLMTTAAHYQKFTNQGAEKTLTVTIDIASGNTSYSVCKLIKETRLGSSVNYHVQELPLSSGRITIQQAGFGGNFADSVTLVPMNTQYGEPYSSYIQYTISASVS